MVDAVRSAYGGNRPATLFQVTPPGIGAGDFSFIVIGDPGEGDASQYSLDRPLPRDLGRREDMKFLIIASDVIYPAGAMVDYESKFYLPFKGFTKPIYAIPGQPRLVRCAGRVQCQLPEAESGARRAIGARARPTSI